MDYFYPLTAFLNAITSFILGVLVYLSDRKAPANKYFALFALSVAFWSGGYFFWQIARDYDIALLWVRLFMAGAILIPILYLHFVIVFLGINHLSKVLLILGYVSVPFFLFFDFFTDKFIRNLSPKLSFDFWPNPGVIFHPYLLMFCGFTLYSWYLLWTSYRTTEVVRKAQINYIFIGTVIGFVGGSTNFFLWYDIPVLPIGNFFVIVYVGMTAWAVVKKQLFGMKVVFTQLIVATIALILAVQLLSPASPTEYALQGATLIGFCILGYLLIQNVRKEVETREQIEKLAGELTKTNTELERVNQAKSDFISMASHQLKTPLSIIKGYVSMTMEGSFGNLSKKIIDQLQKVYISNERLIALVDDLLNLSRVEEGRMKYDFSEEHIADIVQQIVDEVQMTVQRKKLQLIWKQPKEKLYARVDLNKMRNVIFNLVDNAIKYTAAGSITIIVYKHDTSLRVAVSDTGRGISSQHIKKLFTKFTRVLEGNASLTTSGFGLGLYVAKLIVEEHKGHIWAGSAGLGKGSMFVLELPLVQPIEKNKKDAMVEQQKKVSSPT